MFLYDRNGLGKSPPDHRLSNNNPLTSKFISDKLLKLLVQNKIKPPYIIVAHSYGGMYAGYFTLKYPNLVKGFIMIDPVPKSFNFSTKVFSNFESGITAAKKLSSADIYQKFGAADTDAIYELIGFNSTKQEVNKLGSISNNIPVIIISSTEMESHNPTNEDWYDSQKQWLNSNAKSKIFIEKSGHAIQLEYPEVVCEQIKELAN